MMWRLLPFGLVAILVAGVLVSNFLACRLVNLSRGRLAGEDPKEECLKGSESFAMMDKPRTMGLLLPGGAGTEKAAAPGDSKIVSVIR